MLEARLNQGSLMKKVVDAVRELVTDANLDCNESGIGLQAMDSSHVALITFLLRSDGFEEYRCDRNIPMGINFATFSKLLKCSGNDDSITLKADDEGDTLNLIFESPKNDRVSEYDMKLMAIDMEHLGIPDPDYDATITMSASEFQRICRDLSVISESVTIEAAKDGVKFSAEGEMGSGTIQLKQTAGVDNDDAGATLIEMNKPVSLTFSLKYFNMFAKATPLSGSVSMHMQEELPIMIEYKIEDIGYLRYYLAPKVGDDE